MLQTAMVRSCQEIGSLNVLINLLSLFALLCQLYNSTGILIKLLNYIIAGLSKTFLQGTGTGGHRRGRQKSWSNSIKGWMGLSFPEPGGDEGLSGGGETLHNKHPRLKWHPNNSFCQKLGDEGKP